MQALIEDLLRYSRAGRGELHVARVDSAEVVARTVDALGVAIGEARAEIEVRDLPVVTADEAALGQVFQNLIANALKYGDGEEPRVEISAVPAGAEWRFSVEDNGIGIEPRHAERVFQMFQRLHTRESYPGTGVGLALCRVAVERHGGRIWCEPRLAGGTAFHFTIPDGEERTA